MGGRPFRHFLGLFLLLLCLKAGLGSSLMMGDAEVGCAEREREALLHFKQGVVDYYELLSSWGNGEDKIDCCKWRGVECNNQTGHVMMLDLHDQSLGGKIGPSLEELQHLKHLNLSSNYFEGVLPTQLGNLSNLQSLDLKYNWGLTCENLDWLSGLPLLTHLDLSGVDLSKAIHWPLAINKMPSLTELYLRFTHLPGIIPTVSISLINSSTSLAVLDLFGNGLTSSIYPWLFNSSSSLVHLQLSYNHLNGSIPEAFGNMTTQLGNLSNLQSLDLAYNGDLTCENLDWLSGLPLLTHLDLSGVNLSKAIHWPLAINKMSSLTELYLSESALPGIIPTVSISLINSSTSLAVLDLSGNGLTSSIYPWLFNSSSSLVQLDLSRNDLNGSILDAFGNMTTLAYLHLSYNHLRGSIPDGFGNMTNLAYLDLSYNEFEGEIPKSLSTSFVHLDLSYNDLNGSIPDAFGNMTTLAYLFLSYNHLRGSIPDAFGNMTTLAYLDLSHNDLNGSIPNAFGNMTTLAYLFLSHNHLRGSIPDAFGNMTTLTALDLSHNGLNGSIPDAFGNMTTLGVLDLSSNQLGGVFPTQLGSHLFGASKLSVLDLSFNSITFNISLEQAPQFQAVSIRLASCKLGPRFPTWLQTQKLLLALDISASGISDVIPNWFRDLTSGLILLNISNNHISGTLPNLQLIHPFFSVDMSSNCLEGPIPQSLFSAHWLDLSNNLFSGSISLLCGTNNQSGRHLSHLDLSNNLLSGELPNCWDQFEYLFVLNLANNTFSGKIKNSIGSLHQIQTLHLRNNSLTGALPTSLKNCKDLQLVDFGRNKLSGKIPAWMGRSLSNLVVLNLRSNQFNGSIPSNLCQLKKIQVLDLSSNILSGAIPKCLNNFTALIQKGSLVVAYNETLVNLAIEEISYIDNTWIQWKGKESEYRKTLRFVKSIDFSSNKLTGEIPSEVTDLVELVALNLSRNNLTGSIPSMIGQLKRLDVLDLSQNQLHGGIPASLSQIAGLSVLDLSNNTLSGKIPSGTQLQSFNASTYEGNPGLCGPPLLKKCLEDEPGEVSTDPSNKEDIQDDVNDIWFYGSVALGFIIGFWGVCGTLLLNSAWRYAYFQFLSKVKDWLYVMMTVSMNRLQRSLQS